jgi:hypothetical protein
MLYVRFPLSLRNVEDLLHERGIEVSHETVRFWWQRFGPDVRAEIRRSGERDALSRWRWHLDEVFVRSTAFSTTSGARGSRGRGAGGLRLKTGTRRRLSSSSES